MRISLLTFIKQRYFFCILDKIHKKKISKKAQSTTNQLLQFLYIDFCGCLTLLLRKNIYSHLLTTLQDTHRTFFKAKIKIFQYFESFKNMVGKELGLSILYLQTDQGSKFFYIQYFELNSNHEKQQQLIVPSTPYENGIAK